VLFGKRRQEAATERIAAAKTLVKTAKEQGYDVSFARGQLKRAEVLFKEGKFEEAETLAGRSETVANAVLKHSDAVLKLVAEIEGYRDELVAYGLDVTDVEADIARIRDLLTKGFVKVQGKIAAAPTYSAGFAARAVTKYAARVKGHEEAAALLAETQKRLELEVASRPNVSAADLKKGAWRGVFDALGKAEEGFDRGRYQEAKDLLQWANALAKETAEQYVTILADLEVAQSARQKLEADGIPPAAVAEVVARAEEALKSGDLELARTATKEARALAESVREQHAGAALALKQAADTIEQSRKWGFNPSAAQAKLDEATRMLHDGQFEKAQITANEASTEAAAIRESHRSLAERIAAVVQEARTLAAVDPAESRRIQETLENVERDLQDGKYKACEESLELAAFMMDALRRKTASRMTATDDLTTAV